MGEYSDYIENGTLISLIFKRVYKQYLNYI